jgi:drug/metabolite transporter (DMT)-like permease
VGTASSPRSLALVGLLALLWGASFPLIKVAVETIPPLTVAAIRAAGGGLLLAALLGPRLGMAWRAARDGDFFVSQALFNVVLPWVLVAWASRLIDAKLTTILNSLSPIFIFLITWAITRHEPATGRKFLGVALGLAGVVAIVGPSALAGLGAHLAAELACVAGSLGYGIAAVIGRRYDRLPALVPAAGSAIAGAAILVPLAAAVDGWPAQASARSLLAVLALAVFSTGAAFVVYFRLLSTIGSIATASQAYLRIVVGVGLSVAFLGERLEPSHWIGLALVVAGVVAMTLRRKGP